jgi:hypothetical protein
MMSVAEEQGGGSEGLMSATEEQGRSSKWVIYLIEVFGST